MTTWNSTPSGQSAEYTLPACVYLLACDPEKGKVRKGDVLGHLVRAAVLVELTERGCLADRDGRAHPVGDRRTGDPLLDGALRGIAAESRPRKWRSLVQRDRKEAVQGARAQLEAAGAVRVEPRTVLPDLVEVGDAAAWKALRGQVADTLLGGRPVAECPPPRAALTALAELGRLPGAGSASDRRRQRRRLRELVERGGPAVVALRTVLEARGAAVAASAAAASS